MSILPVKKELSPEDLSPISHMEISRPLPKPCEIGMLTADLARKSLINDNLASSINGEKKCPGAPRKLKPVVLGPQTRISPREYQRRIAEARANEEKNLKKPKIKTPEKMRYRINLKSQGRHPKLKRLISRITHPFQVDSIRQEATLSRLIDKLSGPEKATTNFNPQNPEATMFFKN